MGLMKPRTSSSTPLQPQSDNRSNTGQTHEDVSSHPHSQKRERLVLVPRVVPATRLCREICVSVSLRRNRALALPAEEVAVAQLAVLFLRGRLKDRCGRKRAKADRVDQFAITIPQVFHKRPIKRNQQ